MAQMETRRGIIGLEAIHPGRSTSDPDSAQFRLWIDKGRGKYRTIEISHYELGRLSKLIGGVIGGAHLKPPRAKS